MNKAEIASRLTARTGLRRAAAMEAVDGVFAIISYALAYRKEVRIAAFGAFGTRSTLGPVPDGTPEPRGRSDIGVDIAEFQGGEDPAGSSDFAFAPMTLQRSRSRHGGPQTAWM